MGHYFGLGLERHRAIEDVRMNIEILKNCTLTMFLEEHCGLNLMPPAPVIPTLLTQTDVNNNKLNTKSLAAATAAAAASPGQKNNQAAANAASTRYVSCNPSVCLLLLRNNNSSSPTHARVALLCCCLFRFAVKVDVETKESITNKLTQAMKAKARIWMQYDGGQNPRIPRCVIPLSWVYYPNLFVAVCRQSRRAKHFARRKVTLVCSMLFCFLW
jgi:hypothetical protein